MKTLKSLVWERDWSYVDPNRLCANTKFGSYKIGEKSWHCFSSSDVYNCKSLEEAKEQAWQHYQKNVEELYE